MVHVFKLLFLRIQLLFLTPTWRCTLSLRSNTFFWPLQADMHADKIPTYVNSFLFIFFNDKKSNQLGSTNKCSSNRKSAEAPFES